MKLCIKCDGVLYICFNIREHIENEHETLPSITEHKIFSHTRILIIISLLESCHDLIYDVIYFISSIYPSTHSTIIPSH